MTIAPRRVRHIPFNDLIDPLVVPLDVDYAAVVDVDVPVVVQFRRALTAQAALAAARNPTAEEAPWHPTFVGLRFDKDARQVVREEAVTRKW